MLQFVKSSHNVESNIHLRTFLCILQDDFVLKNGVFWVSVMSNVKLSITTTVKYKPISSGFCSVANVFRNSENAPSFSRSSVYVPT